MSSLQKMIKDKNKARGFRSVDLKSQSSAVSSHSASSQHSTPASQTYRIDIQKLKSQTKCHHCGEVGHWKKECPEKSRDKVSSTGFKNFKGKGKK